MNFKDLVIDLVYETYAYNRDRSPEISPERWEKVFGPEVYLMESEYQAKKAIAKAAA